MIDHPITHGSQYSRWNKEKGYEDCKIPSRLTGIPKYKEAEVLCIIDRIKQERDSLGLTDCKNVYDSLAFPDPETGKNGRGCYITIPTDVKHLVTEKPTYQLMWIACQHAQNQQYMLKIEKNKPYFVKFLVYTFLNGVFTLLHICL